MLGLVMAAWNAEEWIAGAITSLAMQSSPLWRLVVVDDGSTDGGMPLVEALMKRPHWGQAVHRIWILRRPHEGLVKSVNAGMSFLKSVFSDTRFVGCLAADDHVSEHYVASLTAALLEHPSAPCAYPRVWEFGERVLEWRPEDYREGVLWERNIIPGCAVWRRSIWEAVGGFDPRFTAGLEDWHFAAKAEALGFVGPLTKPIRVEPAIYWHRVHGASLSEQMADDYRVWAQSEIARCFGGARVQKPTDSPLPLHARGPLPVGPYTQGTP
jgi:GT2 family glycosyltransferase